MLSLSLSLDFVLPFVQNNDVLQILQIEEIDFRYNKMLKCF